MERLKRGHRVQVLPEDGALYKIRFSIRKNMVEVMLDTSGDGLHKRGYRKNSMEAPIKETLAAAIIDLGRIYPDTLAQDPFCGSGTLMIEAAMKAMNMAPRPAAPLYGGALCVSACRRLERAAGESPFGDPAGRGIPRRRL